MTRKAQKQHKLKTDQEKARAFKVEQNSEISDLEIEVVLELDTLNIDIELTLNWFEKSWNL